MAPKNPPAENLADREIVFTRVFDAPREMVFAAWTDPKQVVRWWGPTGFTTTIQEMDVRPGGKWVHVMHGPDGTDYPNESVYIEVVRPERIVYSHGGGKAGGPEAEFEMTATFEDVGGKTKLTMRMLFPTAAQRDAVIKAYGAVEGGQQTLNRLEQFLKPPKHSEGEAMAIQPYLFFEGRCEEAAEFYGKAVGAEVKMLMRYKDSPEPHQSGKQAPPPDKVMHMRLQIGNAVILASDGHCSGKPNFQGFFLSLTVADEAEASRLFKGLSDGGKVIMPQGKTFFSPSFGMLSDRFGVGWMIYVAPPGAY